MDTDNLFQVTSQDVLAHKPILPTEEPLPQVQYIEDLVHLRYGFHLDGVVNEHMRVPNIFDNWTMVCRSVGGQHLDFSSKDNRVPVRDFLNILIGTKQPFSEMPAVYWDLSPQNCASLSRQTPGHFRIEVKHFGSDTLCLLHPRGLHPSQCPCWILAVSPMTALECIRRGLGPDPYRVAEYFVETGMEFRTLQQINFRPPCTRPTPSSSTGMLGKRLHGHKYDSADFAQYLDVRETYLETHSNARRALSIGGVIARLARETLSVSVILAGPSQDALEGKQDVFFSDDAVYVDDGLSEEVKQMIGGTYSQETGTISMLFFSVFFFILINSRSAQIKLQCAPGSHLRRPGQFRVTMLVIGIRNVRTGIVGFFRVPPQGRNHHDRSQNGGTPCG